MSDAAMPVFILREARDFPPGLALECHCAHRQNGE